jgi:hypothetical protein
MTKRRETESEKEIEERVTRRSNSNMKGHARISTKMYPLAAAAHVSVFTCACVSVGVGGGDDFALRTRKKGENEKGRIKEKKDRRNAR